MTHEDRYRLLGFFHNLGYLQSLILHYIHSQCLYSMASILSPQYTYYIIKRPCEFQIIIGLTVVPDNDHM